MHAGQWILRQSSFYYVIVLHKRARNQHLLSIDSVSSFEISQYLQRNYDKQKHRLAISIANENHLIASRVLAMVSNTINPLVNISVIYSLSFPKTVIACFFLVRPVRCVYNEENVASQS